MNPKTRIALVVFVFLTLGSAVAAAQDAGGAKLSITSIA